MLGNFTLAILLLILTGCNNSLVLSGQKPSAITIEGLDRLSAKPGEIVTVKGTNLTDDIEVLVNGEPAKFQKINSKTATIEMPATMEEGVVRITFARKSKPISSIPLMNENSVSTLSTTSVPLESICDTYIVKTKESELARGKADCTRAQNLCNRDGQSDCTTSASFPAVVRATLASKIIAGESVSGVSGEAAAGCDP